MRAEQFSKINTMLVNKRGAWTESCKNSEQWKQAVLSSVLTERMTLSIRDGNRGVVSKKFFDSLVLSVGSDGHLEMQSPVILKRLELSAFGEVTGRCYLSPDATVNIHALTAKGLEIIRINWPEVAQHVGRYTLVGHQPALYSIR